MTAVRVAVAQIDFFPAALTSSINYLQEPTGEDCGLHGLRMLKPVETLCQGIEKAYVQKLSLKIQSVLLHAQKYGADIIVFPEYSIPPHLLPVLNEFSKKNDLVIVAGTHTVSRNAQELYRQAELTINLSGQNSDVRKSVCPILSPSGNSLIKKRIKSKWETDMITDREERQSLNIRVRDKEFKLYVLICIEALREGLPQVDSNTLVVIPAWTPTLEEFDDLSRVRLINEVPTVFSNTSQIGGSKIFARFQANHHGMVEDSASTVALARDTEAVIIADIDLESQFLKKKSTTEHVPAEVVTFSPLLYMDDAENDDFLRKCVAVTHDRSQEIPDYPNWLWQRKIAVVKADQLHGNLRDEEIKDILSYVHIDKDANLQDFRRQNVETALHTVTALVGEGSGGYLYQLTQAIQSLSVRLGKFSEEAPRTTVDTYDDKPYVDRETLFEQANRFFGDFTQRVMLIRGMRGIGKTHFVHQLFKRVLPAAKWTKIDLNITPGTGAMRFFGQLNYNLGMIIPLQELEEAVENQEFSKICETLIQSFDTVHNACLVIHNWQHVLNGSGDYREECFEIFVQTLLTRESYNGNKVIIVGTRAPKFDARITDLKVMPLENKYVKEILDYYLRLNKGASHVLDSERIVPFLYGHPYSAILAAQQMSDERIRGVSENPEVFHRFRESIVDHLLEGIPLSPDHLQVVRVLSMMNLPVDVDFIWYVIERDPSNDLEDLAGMFFVDVNDRGLYLLHPLLRKHFYETIEEQERLQLHRKIAVKYESWCTGDSPEPEHIGETVYHYAASLDLKKAMEFKQMYGSELLPVAVQLYKRRKYAEAARYFEALSRMQNNIDVEYRLAVCYAHMKDWGKSRDHFEQAIQFDPTAWWAYSGYAYALVSSSRDLRREAETLALQADEIATSMGVSVLDKARIKSVLGKIRELDGDQIGAERLYRESIDDNPGHIQGYILLINLYKKAQRLTEAADLISKGLASNPYHPRLIELRESLFMTNGEVSDEQEEVDEEAEITVI